MKNLSKLAIVEDLMAVYTQVHFLILKLAVASISKIIY